MITKSNVFPSDICQTLADGMMKSLLESAVQLTRTVCNDRYANIIVR
jgi:uncharacterized hydantoinase/oxoprolinase family protein